MEEEKVKCGNCRCWRHAADFIGKKGVPVKTCVKCREKDAIKKSTPEARAKKSERDSETKSYQKSREKQKAENPEEYLKKQAAAMRAWREKRRVVEE